MFSRRAWPSSTPYRNAASAWVRTASIEFTHEDAWAGFVEVHQALVAAGAEGALLPVRSHLLQVLEPATVADAIAAYLNS